VQGPGRLRRHLGLATEIIGYLFWLLLDVIGAAAAGSWLNVVAGVAVPVVVLLRRRPGFRRLWLAGAVSETGDWLLLIALPVYVLQLTGSAMTTREALAAASQPPAAGVPPA